ncbi:hypothetical protein [Shewanella sp. YIC-542]|uniref:hypothetical protein n=1 Tax=Shewanella mytili TaxID=3377111 RepID=UPI00398EF283
MLIILMLIIAAMMYVGVMEIQMKRQKFESKYTVDYSQEERAEVLFGIPLIELFGLEFYWDKAEYDEMMQICRIEVYPESIDKEIRALINRTYTILEPSARFDDTQCRMGELMLQFDLMGYMVSWKKGQRDEVIAAIKKRHTDPEAFEDAVENDHPIRAKPLPPGVYY